MKYRQITGAINYAIEEIIFEQSEILDKEEKEGYNNKDYKVLEEVNKLLKETVQKIYTIR